MPQPEGKRCEQCRYSDDQDNGTFLCRKNAPRPFPNPVEDTNTVMVWFPSMNYNEWCGEWEPAHPESLSEAATTIARLVVIGDKSGVYALVDKLLEDRAEESKPTTTAENP